MATEVINGIEVADYRVQRTSEQLPDTVDDLKSYLERYIRTDVTTVNSSLKTPTIY